MKRGRAIVIPFTISRKLLYVLVRLTCQSIGIPCRPHMQ